MHVEWVLFVHTWHEVPCGSVHALYMYIWYCSVLHVYKQWMRYCMLASCAPTHRQISHPTNTQTIQILYTTHHTCPHIRGGSTLCWVSSYTLCVSMTPAKPTEWLNCSPFGQLCWSVSCCRIATYNKIWEQSCICRYSGCGMLLDGRVRESIVHYCTCWMYTCVSVLMALVSVIYHSTDELLCMRPVRMVMNGVWSYCWIMEQIPTLRIRWDI